VTMEIPTPEQLLQQVQSDIDTQRSQCDTLDAELARLEEQQKEKDAVYAGLQNTRNTCLIAFMREHAQEEASRRRVVEAQEQNETQWQVLVSLQAQLAAVEAKLAEHSRGEEATVALRQRHHLCLQRVQERLAIPEAILRSECDVMVGALRAVDHGRQQLEEAAERRRLEEEAASPATAADSLQFDNEFDDDCLPDAILMMMDEGALATGDSQH